MGAVVVADSGTGAAPAVFYVSVPGNLGGEQRGHAGLLAAAQRDAAGGRLGLRVGVGVGHDDAARTWRRNGDGNNP